MTAVAQGAQRGIWRRMKDFLTFAGVDPASRHAANLERA
jgi:hypothetical protein